MQVGDYVRTKHYGIFKIRKIIKENNKIVFLKELGHTVVMSDKYNPIEDEIIGQPSKNPIDLIEVGDVIRYRIDNVAMSTKGYIEGIVDISYNKMLESIKEDKNYHILSIVTHEQIESMEYKVDLVEKDED